MASSSKLTGFYDKLPKILAKQTKGNSLTVTPFTIAVNKGYINPPVTSSSIVHDNACGTGVVTKEFIGRARATGEQPPRILATDINPKLLEAVKKEKEASGWNSVTVEVADCNDMKGLESDYFTHSITNFGIWEAGAAEIHRTLRKGGLAFITTFKSQPWVALANEIKDSIKPGLPKFPPGFSAEWFTKEFVGDKMRSAGFRDPKHDIVTFEITMDSVEEMVKEFHEPFWMMARSDFTEEEKGRWDPVLREKLEQLPSLTFTFEVWCTSARK